MRRILSQPLKRHRNGSSLVEVVIGMSLASIVLSLGVGMLHLLMRSESALSDSLNRFQAGSQLSRQFRSDIHAARSAAIEAPARDDPQSQPVLKLQLGPDREVRYAAADHAVERTETQGDKVLQSVRFRFSKGTVIEFSQADQTPPRVAIVVKSPSLKTARLRTSEPVGRLRELKIEARLGRDHRFESKTPPQ